MICSHQETCSSSSNPMQYSMVFGSCDGEGGEGSTSAINCVKVLCDDHVNTVLDGLRLV